MSAQPIHKESIYLDLIYQLISLSGSHHAHQAGGILCKISQLGQETHKNIPSSLSQELWSSGSE